MILQTMLNRLHASLVHGPSMNARPHRSRQRIDLLELAAFQGREVQGLLAELLEKGSVELPAKAPRFDAPEYPESEWSDEHKAARTAWDRQRRLLDKLRAIAVDAQDYFNDHGESALGLGFPVLALPPVEGGRGGAASGRVLAPLAFVPLEMQVRQGSRPGVTLRCLGEGADLLVPNPALLAYLEQQTGESIDALFADDEGADPWRELAEMLAYVIRATKLDPAPVFTVDTPVSPVPETADLPKTATLLPSAVLGLFPLMNQALLRDTQWMLEREAEMSGPVASFLRQDALAPETAEMPEAEEFTVEEQATITRGFSEEWLVTQADPCQAQAVQAARSSRALVVHGPPGTGKSQTIANIIGDHLARGERVLFVCDKRTALDVVKYRLDALGLGHLCGVVHDPTLDRRALYMHFRAQLESLAETELPPNPEATLQQVNARLQDLHRELASYRASLHLPGPDGKSFHDLLGAWLDLAGDPTLPVVAAAPELRPADVEAHRTSLDEILRRAVRAGYATNPFRKRLGIMLGDFLGQEPAAWEKHLAELARVAARADDLRPADALPLGDSPLGEQAAAFLKVADLLTPLLAPNAAAICAHLSGTTAEEKGRWRQEVASAAEWIALVEQAPLERELELAVQGAPVALAELNSRIQALETWLPISDSFRRFFSFGAKAGAGAALAPLGLSLDRTGTQRGLAFYRGGRARLLLTDLVQRANGRAEPAPSSLPDAELRSAHTAIQNSLEIHSLLAAPALAAAAGRILPVLKDAAAHGSGLITALRASAPWAEALEIALAAAAQTRLFRAEALQHFRGEGAAGKAAALSTAWHTAHPQLEEMVRIDATMAILPLYLHEPVDALAADGVELAGALAALQRIGLENALRERVRTDAALAAVDGDRIEAAFATFLELSVQKQELVRAHVRHHWLARQKRRLVAATGSQLNKHGAALRQRLFVKGKRALKLRQMIATGADSEGGDPLYDLCPVWMASPSTVAQVFPREPYFQVVIFDEASQCRLEEALPVLLRGHRVVVAGDPKQLPPTRFFETSVADTGDTDAETGEELFQQQQSDAEDLLSAALNLDVREAFLDVHYRSRNEALIGFSNQAFYHERLQPIPGHPKNRAMRAPILLHRVDGAYRNRTNREEAERAAELVASLLESEAPPSIGIACFNLTQRDQILGVLDERAQQDPAFARRLDEAKKRRGRDSFEGLFVKNLENVQGDERDVMIISTTFGLDEEGKFRRNFGALSRQDGGRRLNVLVTRARQAIHVLTSIPRSEYHTPESLEEGRQPTGRHHLYSYLRYAERLHEQFERYSDSLEKMQRDHVPALEIQDTPTPSTVAVALGRELHQRHAIGGTVHWGNEGFCVDAALAHPELPVDVTIGLLADFTRFRKTPDPIEWDLFRTHVLRGQGWELLRLWSPTIFRRGEQILQQVVEAHRRVAGESERFNESGVDA